VKLQSLSEISASFPTLEVEYEDLLQYRYVRDARGENKTIDCLGIAIEIYRRAGLQLPDLREGNVVDNFYEVFEEIETADTLFDLIYMRRDTDGLFTVVRPGIALTIVPAAGAFTRKVMAVESREGVLSYRVRPECLP
jgi:hypothetical protein